MELQLYIFDIQFIFRRWKLDRDANCAFSDCFVNAKVRTLEKQFIAGAGAKHGEIQKSDPITKRFCEHMHRGWFVLLWQFI